ncbi:MAG: phosphatidylglycerophosphatase A [Thermodesulfovibrionales bacterium]|nr:phosphatidylglycerophosphatase A [Thermodesulfovibrionales bacterium]
MAFLKQIATLGFIGYLPFAPGTLGTLAALIFMLILKPPLSLHIGLTVFFMIAGIVSSDKAEKLFGQKDSRHIVIDEFAGYMASLLFLPLSWGYIIAAFVLFRFFDILKPPPLRRLEGVFNGGFGMMADDIGAAAYTNLVLQLWKLLN